MSQEEKKRISKRNLPLGVRLCVKTTQAKKGEDVVVLDLRGISSFTDFFIITHGNSSRHNQALYEHIENELRKGNIRPLGVEGVEHGEWILMDYGDFIVHVFSKRARDYYSLEKLWRDAAKISF